MPKKKEIDHELQEALKDIVKKCESEDEFVRRAQIRTWKKNEEFWHGVQYLFWNEKGQTWISPMSGAAPNLGFSEEEITELGPFYDFVIDIFSAHGQSIISALSNQVPSVKFLPDDGSDDEDVDTAKTYDKISELVARHNNAKLKFIQTLFFLYINGIVFSYRYIDTDKKYGVYKVPVFENQDVTTLICPECNADLGATNEGKDVEESTNADAFEAEEAAEELDTENRKGKNLNEHTSDEGFEGDKETGEEEDSYEKNKGDKEDTKDKGSRICPECQQEMIPEEQKSQVPLYVRDEDKPKSRVKHEIY